MKTPPFKPLASLVGALLFTAMSSIADPIVVNPTDPQTVTVRDGLTATMTVTGGSNTNEKIGYRWYKVNTAVAGPEDDVRVVDGSGISGSGTGTLKFTGAKGEHSGDYYAEVFERVTPFPEISSPIFTLQVNVRPKIKTTPTSGQPQSATVSQGAGVSLAVVLTDDSTPAGLTYQWQKNNVDIPTGVNPTADEATFVIPAASVGSETTEGAQWPDAGSYRVKIVSSLTSTTLFSKAAVLKVNSQPFILTQPAAATGGTLYVATKATGKLSVLAGGNPKLEYQWEKVNGTAETTDDDVLNAKASSLSVKEEGTYRVRVKNFLSGTPLGTISNYANVVVLNKPTEVGTIVATSNKPAQPNAKGEFEANDMGGDTEVTLTVAPNLTGTGALEFQWQKDGKNIFDEPAGTTGVTGAQTAAIKFAPLSWTHRGVYRCVIKNKVGVYTSKTFALKVNSKPLLITPPTDLLGVKDKAVTFSLVAGGNAPLTYKWYREGQPETVLGTAAKFTRSKLGDTDEGNYYCVISNSFGTFTTELVNLQVDVPVKIGLQPAAAAVTSGNTLTLSINTSQGDGPIKYQWQRNNVNLTNSPRITGAQTTVTGPADLDLRATVQLVITDLTTADAGSYRCIVSNVNDTVKVTSATAKVTVLTAPFFLVDGQPLDKEVFEDSNVSFTVKAGGSPTLKYQWEKASSLAGPWTVLAGKTAATLTLTNVQLDPEIGNQGFYRCVVNNTTGVPATSNPAQLTINLIPDPTITSFTPHKARTGDKIRILGTNLEFVSEVRFKNADTGIKAIPVKEPGGTLLISVPPGLLGGEEVELFAKSKNGFDGSEAETFSRVSVQVNDRRNPTILVGTTFPATVGATTAGMQDFDVLPATGLGEAVFTWVFPKAGYYQFNIRTFGQYVFHRIQFPGTNIQTLGTYNTVFSRTVEIEDDNTPVTITVYGIDGAAFPPLQDFGNYTIACAYSARPPSPVAPAPSSASLASWQTDGETGDLRMVQTDEGREKSSFTGSSAEGAQPTVLWTDASEVQAGPDSVVRTEWTMDIDQAGAGTKGHFGWQVTGSNGSPLGQLQFSVEDGAIYAVQPDGTRTALEPVLVPGSSHRFEITTDLGNATWQARIDGVALGEPLPLPANSGFGDVSVIWYPASGSAQPTMTFDGVTVTVD
ncbi:MAG: immunoglobulin domain-containing protein [Verrucomicrobiota bacterium]